MSAVENYDVEDSSGAVLGAAPDVVEVRRNGGLAALIGVVSSAVAIAWLGRATQTGSWVDWALFAVLGVLGAMWLHAFFDARTPLLVADAQGVRLRLGKVWRGLPWGALAAVEHTPRRGLLRDGKLVLVPHNPERIHEELDRSGRRQSMLAQKMYGAPFAVPLGLSTRVPGKPGDLTTSLRQLAGGATRVLEPELPVEDQSIAEETVEEEAPELWEAGGLDDRGGDPDAVRADHVDEDAEEETEREPRLGGAFGRVKASLAARIARGRREEFATDTTEAESDEPRISEQFEPEPTQPLVASATPAPLREVKPASRIEIHSNLFVEGAAARATDEDGDGAAGSLPEGRELRRQGSVPLVEETSAWGDRVRPIATVKDAVEPLVIDDYAVEPAQDPVIGPDITAARTRIGLSIDALADRTRIRPHVIESIEVDDFVPCGGDFYARGHLRTLARVLGIESEPLLTAYDERYADAPINPRRVFEAELATGANGGIRSTKGGPNWSVLIAAIMTVVLAWSIARLIMDTPVELQSPAPILNGSDGPNQTAPVASSVTLKVTANSETHLVVRNGKDKVIFDDDLAYGDVHRLDVLPPFQVKATDAGAVDLEINGRPQGALGESGKEAQKTFRVKQ